MEDDHFVPPYRRRSTYPTDNNKRGARRGCCSSCFCSTVAIIAGLSILATIACLLVVIFDRVQQLESYHVNDNLLYDSFRSERVECFHIDTSEQKFMMINAPEASLDDAADLADVSYTDSAVSPEFHLSGYDGQLLVNIRAHEGRREKYLYVKYRPVAGDVFPMQKRISISLLHPTNAELAIRKQFKTSEAIAKGAMTFVEPNGEFWALNFCSMDIIESFVNNKLICVAISISEPAPHK